MVRINRADHWMIQAQTIYNDFEVHQSCAVELEYGEKIWNEIVRIDREQNTIIHASGKRMRKYQKYPNSSGAGIAQKIFRFKAGSDRWTIWRAQ